MILNKNGETFDYEGKKYTVGEFIYVNENSDYAGLFGVIKEIRDGEDKDTDNDTPDIYCSFENPVMPYDIRRVEDRFSTLYGEKNYRRSGAGRSNYGTRRNFGCTYTRNSNKQF